MEYAYRTDCGVVRPKNEDNTCIVSLENGDLLMVVLDGMGGHNKGEKASSMAMQIISGTLKEKGKFKTVFGAKSTLIKAIRRANKEVNTLGSNNIEYNEMGTTVIAALVHQNKVIVANVGDSRLYFFEKGKMNQISEDQTYVQFLYKTGKIKKEDMKIHPKRHVLMNALGTYPSLNIDTKVYDYSHQGMLLCSDGLYNMLEDEEICDILQRSLAVEDKVNLLIHAANEHGGMDNIAIALLEEER